MQNAVEAIACHVEGILIDNEDLPTPHAMEQYISKPEYQDVTWALVKLDT